MWSDHFRHYKTQCSLEIRILVLKLASTETSIAIPSLVKHPASVPNLHPQNMQVCTWKGQFFLQIFNIEGRASDFPNALFLAAGSTDRDLGDSMDAFFL